MNSSNFYTLRSDKLSFTSIDSFDDNEEIELFGNTYKYVKKLDKIEITSTKDSSPSSTFTIIKPFHDNEEIELFGNTYKYVKESDKIEIIPNIVSSSSPSSSTNIAPLSNGNVLYNNTNSLSTMDSAHITPLNGVTNLDSTFSLKEKNVDYESGLNMSDTHTKDILQYN